jgi:hypothetical protein
MDMLTSVLGKRVRQNHALEHGTISVLTRKNPDLRLSGRSVEDGFYVYGKVDPAELEDAARQALKRFQGGERGLAVHARCGTNLAVAGVLAGVASMLAFRRQRGAEGLPSAILGSTIAVIVSQPLGRMVQRHLTTSSQLDDVVVRGVRKFRFLRIEGYKVETFVNGHMPRLVEAVPGNP